MPIHSPISLCDFTQHEFDALDKVVMKHAYAAQNKLGRLFDERIYENEMARTLREAGHEVYTQVPVTIRNGEFQMIYYLDLVVDHMLYEIKTVSAFAPEHEAQALHYAMLMNIRRAKLLNFRLERVQGKLCFNRLTQADRYRPAFETTRWSSFSESCDRLRHRLQEVVSDWGTHLSTGLYTEALVHFCGGEEYCQRRIPVEGLGTHSIRSHSPGMTFLLTSLTRGIEDYHSHLCRMVGSMDLIGVQWFNFNHSVVECRTVVKR